MDSTINVNTAQSKYISSENPIEDNTGVFISHKFAYSQNTETPEVSITLPKVDIRRPNDQNEELKKKDILTESKKNKKKLQLEESIKNRQSTPRPSILLVNSLGEGKMIELDINALKTISR